MLSHYFCKLPLFRIFLHTTGVQVTIFALDFRVNVLDKNLNSSVAELAMRVETLEGTAVDHETRISAAELDINGNSSKQIKTSESFHSFIWG